MFHVKTFRNDNFFLSSSSSCSPRLSSEIELSSESIRSLWPSKLLLTYFSTLCLLFLLCCLVYTRLKELKAEVLQAKVDRLSRTSQLFFFYLYVEERASEEEKFNFSAAEQKTTTFINSAVESLDEILDRARRATPGQVSRRLHVALFASITAISPYERMEWSNRRQMSVDI